MTPKGGRGLHRTSLIALGLLATGCAPQDSTAALEPPPAVRPDGGQSYLALGKRFLASNQPALAMKAFAASMSAEGRSAAAVTGAGIAAERQGMLTEARRHFERARELAPESAVVHNNLGVVLYKLGDYHGARSAFRAALERSGGESRPARENLEQTEAAIARLELDPVANPAETWEVVRLGSDRFRLVEATPPEPDGEAEAD